LLNVCRSTNIAWAKINSSLCNPPCSLFPVLHCRHIIGGVEYSLELCSVGGASSLGGLLSKMGFSSVSRASANQVAAAFVGDKIRKALQAAHVATQVMAALQV
jgi:hypothetical protein